MKLKYLLAAAAAFAVLPAQAQAQDDDTGTFTGPRIQVQGGWDRAGIQVFDERNFQGRGSVGRTQHDDAIAFGGEVGFDFDLGGIVIGAYAGADFSNAEETFTTPRAVTLSADQNMYAGARAGIVAGDRTLLYVKGGLSRGNLDVEFGPGAVTTGFEDVDDRDGYHFGGGFEFAATDMIYFRIDYMHTSYDDVSLGTLGVVGPTTSPNFEQRFNRNQVTAAIGLRF